MAKKLKKSKKTKKITSKYISVSKPLAYTLIGSILLMLGVTINETLAGENKVDRETKFQEFYETKKNIELEKESEIKLDSVITRIEKVITEKSKYKELFEDTLRKELEELPEYKLRLALKRIETKVNSTKYNQLLNENSRGNITAQLLAIKEIIIEIQNNDKEIQKTINIEEIIK